MDKQQFLILAKSTRGRALCELISKATAEPGIFTFGELLSLPNVQEVGKYTVMCCPRPCGCEIIGNEGGVLHQQITCYVWTVPHIFGPRTPLHGVNRHPINIQATHVHPQLLSLCAVDGC